MRTEFKEAVILLMQHPVMNTPIDNIGVNQTKEAYDLVTDLLDQSVDDEFTRLDYIQCARLELLLGELSLRLGRNEKIVISHYHNAFIHLDRGGLDLSVKKWADLASIRMIEVDSMAGYISKEH